MPDSSEGHPCIHFTNHPLAPTGSWLFSAYDRLWLRSFPSQPSRTLSPFGFFKIVLNEGAVSLYPFFRRAYFAVEGYFFSFSRKYCSDVMVFPSEVRIRYGFPEIEDVEAQSLIKSSAVWTLPPTF